MANGNLNWWKCRGSWVLILFSSLAEYRDIVCFKTPRAAELAGVLHRMLTTDWHQQLSNCNPYCDWMNAPLRHQKPHAVLLWSCSRRRLPCALPCHFPIQHYIVRIYYLVFAWCKFFPDGSAAFLSVISAFVACGLYLHLQCGAKAIFMVPGGWHYT